MRFPITRAAFLTINGTDKTTTYGENIVHQDEKLRALLSDFSRRSDQAYLRICDLVKSDHFSQHWHQTICLLSASLQLSRRKAKANWENCRTLPTEGADFRPKFGNSRQPPRRYGLNVARQIHCC
jgi:hypothetical protein